MYLELKVTKEKTDFEVEYLNNRLTEIDNRLFNIEERIENSTLKALVSN